MLKHRSLVYEPLFVILYLISLLPSWLLHGIRKIVYWSVYKLATYRYDVVIQNLSRSFPEKDYRQIQAIARSFYLHFSELLVETLQLLSMSEKEHRQRIHLHNPEVLEHCHQQGRNIVILMGHYGNWECLNILPRYLSFDVYAVYKPTSSNFLNRLLYRIRSRFGIRLLTTGETARFMLSNRDQPNAYVFIADQSPAARPRYQTDFLHQPTGLFTGAEHLARSLDAVVLYASVRKRSTGNGWNVYFSLIAEEPADVESYEITKAFAWYLEHDIMHAPEYWLWTHRQWEREEH
ncbi:lysophospholipid acyltransferase family protein [Chitinophaga sp. B61]|uniref:Lysophospholipid acyltransferase family protein n=2 Tax=Chitinophaga rhizophila TaxID=2866212 RepID=A0ABS7GIA4_9BACT|nr:lysophospholipid acyltransferase family protein [Chitinophaga rhizophila]